MKISIKNMLWLFVTLGGTILVANIISALTWLFLILIFKRFFPGLPWPNEIAWCFGAGMMFVFMYYIFKSGLFEKITPK